MNKTVIISGGTSGIGKAGVERLLQDGFNVATFSRDKGKCKDLEIRLQQNWDSERFLITSADVSNENEMHDFVATTLKKFNSIDILVNNAGFGYFEECDKVDMEKFQEMINTNLVGVAVLTKAAVPQMKKQKSGLIINIVSMSGRRSYPKGEFYSATKFGVMGYSDGLRKELEEHNIKVSTICPGVIETDFFTEEWKEKRRSENKPMMKPVDISRIISLICTQSEHSNIQHVELIPF